MNYKIITDEKKLLEFIDWLPELEENEKYYCCLFSRKKYCSGQIASNDKTQLKRFLSTKERLYEKIKLLEVEKGAYKLKRNEAPQESLALYINPNPRNLVKATYDVIIRLTELLKNGVKTFNPDAETMNCIQKCAGRNIFMDFDVDTEDFDFEKLKGKINTSCLKILKTRGGFHILVRIPDIAPEFRTSYFNQIRSLGVDQTGDQLLPVPGCLQGGFTPGFIDVF